MPHKTNQKEFLLKKVFFKNFSKKFPLKPHNQMAKLEENPEKRLLYVTIRRSSVVF